MLATIKAFAWCLGVNNMAVGLGGTILDSRLLALNIVFVQSFYYLSFGMVLFMVEQEYASTAAISADFLTADASPETVSRASAPPPQPTGAPVPSATVSSPAPLPSATASRRGRPTVLSLETMFGGVPMVSWHVAICAYAIHGFVFGILAGYTIDRKTWSPDVVGTSVLIHLVLCFIVAGWPKDMRVWWTCLVDGAAALTTAWYFAARREMQDIPVQQSAASDSEVGGADVTASATKRRAADTALSR